MHRRSLALVAFVAAFIPAAAAQAHVTLQPKEAPAGSYVVESVRVPNETDDATTTKIRVQMPPGIDELLYSAQPGWTQKFADGELTLTADSTADGIKPGEFKDFPISIQVPGKEGDTLTFKALQTYSNGDVVRWIGAPDADEPAPTIAVTAAEEDHGHSAAKSEQSAAPAAAPTNGGGGGGDDGGDGLAIVALIVGALGLAAGAAGVTIARRAQTA